MKFYYGKHYINTKDIKFITSKISNKKNLTEGENLKKLEKNFSIFCNSKYSIACSSGTSAIFLACKAIGLKKNDCVVIPSINFVAAASVCSQLGAKVYFADVDYNTGQSLPCQIEQCIKKNKIKKLKLFFSMYLGGVANNILGYNQLMKKYKCHFIEDACHALGANYIEKPKIKIGSSRFSSITVFSFHPVKTITSGEGGLLTTNNYKLYKEVVKFRSHGIERKFFKKTKFSFDYDIKNLSYNFRLSEINCALAISQLKKIKKFIFVRRNLAKYYYSQLRSFKKYITIVNQEYINFSACHLLLLQFKNFPFNKEKFIKYMLKKNIVPQFHYRPTQTFSFFKKRNFHLKNSISFFYNSTSMPIFYEIKKKHIKIICNCLKNFVKKNQSKSVSKKK